MKAKKEGRNLRFFESRLEQIINRKHGLCVLAGEIDCSVFEMEFGAHYSEGKGRPGRLRLRLRKLLRASLAHGRPDFEGDSEFGPRSGPHRRCNGWITAFFGGG